MLLLFSNILLYFNPSSPFMLQCHLKAVKPPRDFQPFVSLAQYTTDLLLQRIPHCSYQTSAKCQDNLSPCLKEGEIHNYLNIGDYKTSITKKRKTSETNSHTNNFTYTNRVKLYLQYCNLERNSPLSLSYLNLLQMHKYSLGYIHYEHRTIITALKTTFQPVHVVYTCAFSDNAFDLQCGKLPGSKLI